VNFHANDSRADVKQPHFGFTRHGLAVHAVTADHHADGTVYQRFNKRVAILLTENVGTMTCFWVFLIASFFVLPSVLYTMGLVSLKHVLPAFILGFGFELLTTWLFSTCVQLVLLPGLMVGQNLQSAAADARNAKMFEDLEDARQQVAEVKAMLVKVVNREAS
jgi:hypothetical protein